MNIEELIDKWTPNPKSVEKMMNYWKW